MTSDYKKLRDNEIKRVGIKAQTEAEKVIEKREEMATVKVYDDAGKVIDAKKDIAEKYIKRGKWSKRILTFTYQSEAYQNNYDLIDWGK